jgi:hypothetical protein
MPSIIGNWRRFVFAADNHGDKCDREAVKAFHKFCSTWKPQIRVHGGDNFDFRPLRKKADKEERRESMIADFEEGKQFLETYRPEVLIAGNHDWRLWDLAGMNNGILSDYAQKCVNEIEALGRRIGFRILPYDKRLGVYRIGSLKCIHGFLCGITAARRTALAYGSVIMGHGHAIDHQTIEGIEPRMGRMVGCLAQLDMDYNRAQISALRHAHGWLAGVVNEKSGEYHCQQIQRIGKQWSHEVFNL